LEEIYPKVLQVLLLVNREYKYYIYFGGTLMGMSEKQVIVITHSPYFVELSLFPLGE
jgi:hypothetical protein